MRFSVTLFYMHDTSYKELCEYLEIGISGVAGRLDDARKQLNRRLWAMVENDVSTNVPKTASV